MILDSGERRTFESGAVRDITEGKGRCDLMPLDVVAKVITGTGGKDLCIDPISQFVQTGETCFLELALINFADMAFDSSMPTMFLEVAKHFEDGSKKYGPDNWRKGLPCSCYVDSSVRHYLKWYRGDTDEPHNRAFVWNVLCCIWTAINKPELNTYKVP